MCFYILYYITSTDTPEQPQNITAVETQSRYLILTWVEPHDNNAPIQGYFVLYNQPNFAGGEMVTQNVSKERVNVTDLFPGVTYNFTVIAYNGIGNSTESELTPLRTLDEGIHITVHAQCWYGVHSDHLIFIAPVNSPQNVTAMSLSSTSINVTWEEVPPIDRNGMITMYEVLYEPLETFGQISSGSGNTTDLFILLDELHPGDNYSISVRAYTSVGNGPYSDVVVEATQEDCKPILYAHVEQ